MNMISLPKDIHHGGILSPCFSVIRKNGPAFTLLFALTGGIYTETPLLISVDMTVSVRPAHLERFTDEEAKLTHVLKPLGVGSDLEHHAYLIAYPNRHDVWVMTSAALDVSIMSNVSNRYVRIIRQLKILNKAFLTIQESSKRPFRSAFRETSLAIFAGSSDIAKFKKKLEHEMEDVIKFGCVALHPDMNMKKIVFFAKKARRYWFECYRARLAGIQSKGRLSQERACTGLKLLENGTIPSEFQDVAKLINSLCCAYLRESKSYAEEVKNSKTELDYLADLLPPYVCEEAFEDHKPAITLKSCVFKYVIIGALLSGNLPPCFTDENDTAGSDLEPVVWVLEQIKKYKTLNHPLLEIPIQTYSLSYRGYVIAPRFMSSHIENRLSDVLYSFLGALIATLREVAEQDCTGMEEHKNLKAHTCAKRHHV